MTDATEAARRILDTPYEGSGLDINDVITVARALLAGNDEVARLREALTKIPASCRYARADRWCGTIDCPCKIAEAALVLQ